MAVVTIEVTQNDIKQGKRGVACGCPIALAVNRTVKPEYIWVQYIWNGLLRFNNAAKAEASELIKLPKDAADFAHEFDNGFAVSPIAFPLDIPEQFLRSAV